jgi:ATP-dependent DNA helicase RecG
MNWLEVLARINTGEDEHTEFRRDFRDRGRVGHALSAFANTEGGLIILGVDDDQQIVGVAEDPESVSERLTGFLQNGLSSPIRARMDRHQDPNGWVHWIEVPRQRGFEPLRYGGRVYVRRGRANVEPAPTELQDLYNLFGYIVTEEQVVEAAGAGDVDLAAFRAYLERLGLDLRTEPQPEFEDDLVNRGVLARNNGELQATLYGLLAFGKAPQSYPQTGNFWVECVSYAGQDRADEVIQVAEGKGRIDEQVRKAVAWLKGLVDCNI